MNHSSDEFGGPATQHSGWLIPLGVFFVTACLSALVLAYYFAPAQPGRGQEQPAPTDATRPIDLSVGVTHFHIPANYIAMASARRGGAQNELALIATLPDLKGYTLDAAPDLTANSPQSRIVDILLKPGQTVLSEKERMDRIYGAQVEDPNGKPGPYGLQQYMFRADSGYHDQDLFVGVTEAGPAVFLCSKPAPDVTSPSCLRDLPFAGNLTLSYRFKRGHLAEWRKIDSGIRMRLSEFRDKS
ncbi:MAG TPA: hypothetical protein VHT51_06385 [Micropepsaceae bacterium]|jgi:hypothetical protein|nr:hypothetical protein [Micropepsaceae bacterium]